MNLHLKKYPCASILFCLGIALCALYASLAFAQEASTGTTSPELEEETGPLREETDTQTEVQESEGVARVLDEQVQNRITNLARNVQNRIVAGIERLSQIARRIETRVDKLEAIGVPTETARHSLENANTELQNATEALEGIEAAVEAAITSNNPKGRYTEVRTKFQTAHNALKLAHVYLRDAVAALRNAIRETEEVRTKRETTGDEEVETIEERNQEQ